VRSDDTAGILGAKNPMVWVGDSVDHGQRRLLQYLNPFSRQRAPASLNLMVRNIGDFL